MKLNFPLAYATMLFVALASQTALAKHACHDDAYKFCHNVIPDHKLIQHCLHKNLYHLSPACRAEFK